MLTLAALELESLTEAMIGSLVAGVGVVFAFSIGVVGLTRASELRDDGRRGVAAFSATVGTLSLVAALGLVVAGLAIFASDGPLF